MGLYGGDTSVKPDKKIGKAAMESAKLGRDYLDWMKDRAKITDRWSAVDRRRQQTVFQPLQDRFIREAQLHDTPGRQKMAANEARADVFQGAKVQNDAMDRELASMGVDPRSGRWGSIRRSMGIDTGLAAAGASNMARNRVRAEGRALRADAINLGSGLAVNPLSSFQAGSQALASGINGAQQGISNQIQGLSANQNVRIANAQTAAQGQGAMFEGLGTLAGFAMFSDENSKVKKKPARGVLEAVREMPAKSWEYDPAAERGDGGGVPHIGPMAQDWKKATGTGDGTSIPIVDAVGVTLAAVQELDKKVTRIARGLPQVEKDAAPARPEKKTSARVARGLPDIARAA